MKKFTSFFSVLLISSLMLVSVNSFANGQNKASANNPADTAIGSGSCFIFALPLQQRNVTCYGGNNSYVVIYSTLGTQPYSYSWSPAVTNFPADTIDAAYGMTAGTYTCTVTDAAGCTTTVKVTITQPPKLTLTTTSVINNICNGGTNGSAAVKAGGGTPSYTYSWAPSGGTDTVAATLAAGAYTVTVTDSNKCKTTDTVTITQPPAMTMVPSVVPSACSGSNGSASVAVSGGTNPYMYSWAPGGQTTDTIKALASGSYTCTVTDSNGCKNNTAVTVTDSTTLAATIVNTANDKCFGDNNGLASVSVTGGMGPATYNWAPVGGTTTSASGLTAGTYTFTATDSVGCKALTLVTITQPNKLLDSLTNIRNIACYGTATGRVNDLVTGGTNPYTYSWSNGATTSNLNNVGPGSYTVSVTDANGCMDSATVTLTQPSTAVADSNKVVSLACYGYNNGSANVYAYGGTPGYTYTWSGGSSNTTSSATGLVAGTYICTIHDSNRCRVRDTIIITQPASFISATDTLQSPVMCNNKAWVVVNGVTSGYTFSWSPAGGNGDTAKGLCDTIYTVTITNTSTGCVESSTVSFKSTTGIPQYVYNPGVKVFPVPARDKVYIAVTDRDFVPQSAAIYDIDGREVINEKVSLLNSAITLNVSSLPEGVYFLKLTGNSVRIVKFTVQK